MKKLILISLLLLTIMSYSQTNSEYITTYKINNAFNLLTRQKIKKLKSIKIYSDSLSIPKLGNYKITQIKTDENYTYFYAENNENTIKLCLGSNNNGKLDDLSNKSIEFDYW